MIGPNSKFLVLSPNGSEILVEGAFRQQLDAAHFLIDSHSDGLYCQRVVDLPNLKQMLIFPDDHAFNSFKLTRFPPPAPPSPPPPPQTLCVDCEQPVLAGLIRCAKHAESHGAHVVEKMAEAVSVLDREREAEMLQRIRDNDTAQSEGKKTKRRGPPAVGHDGFDDA
jgi:hypothetical protein